MQALFKNKALTARKIEQEVFLYDRIEGFIHSFNETGTFLWEHCDAPSATREQLTDLLAQTYEIDPNAAARDVEEFLSLCIDKKLLTTHA
jgi:hypothetical protein